MSSFFLSLDSLFSKLVLDAPKITANALQIIKSFCDDEVSLCVVCTVCIYVYTCVQYICMCVLCVSATQKERAFLGLTTLRDLIQKRPANTELCLHTLLQVTMSEMDMVRIESMP